MPEVTPVEIRAAVAHSAQEPTEATQEWLNAAPERRRNLRPSGRGGCQNSGQLNIAVSSGRIGKSTAYLKAPQLQELKAFVEAASAKL